ncbi:MAG: adenine phosphoribosyltransferase [Candidatus Thermoplasmatota archaeon]|nr:adenine phosphoribosyltransferase [Candidatus Thermoplasmatota archaeon]
MTDAFIERLRGTVRTVPDFPIEGIMFRDISPVLSEPGMLDEITDRFVHDMEQRGWKPDVVIGPEARGFIFGPLLASRLGIGFVPIRKPGKLPSEVSSIEYTLEYGSNTLEIHTDALEENQNVVIVDDLLATGGTIGACAELCQTLGANVVGALFVIELIGLGARENLSPIEVHSLLDFPA